MVPPKDEYETHGGEDVPVLANGPWAHIFTGVHEQSYFCHAIEFAAGWSELANLGSASASTSGQISVSGNHGFLLMIFPVWMYLH